MMRNFVAVVLMSVMAASAHSHSLSHFKYNETQGRCENDLGQCGFNEANVKELFSNFDKEKNTYEGVDAECVDFREFDFVKQLGFGNRIMLHWNFKGANFSDVKLHFVHITDSDLSGTNFKGMEWGYVSLTGKIDKNTILPESCEGNVDTVDCKQ